MMYALSSSFGFLFSSFLAPQMPRVKGSREMSLGEGIWVADELLAIPCNISCRPGR